MGESAFHERYSNASPVPALPKFKRWKAQLPWPCKSMHGYEITPEAGHDFRLRML